MQIKIDKTFQVDAPIDAVWALLSNPNRVVSCVPGAQIKETIDEQNYKGSVLMKIGPVVTDFRGDIQIERSDADTHELILGGSGIDAKGKGRATMKMTGRLKELDSGGTEVSTSMEVSVIGKLAQFGARLMEDVSNRIFDQFTGCFEQSLETEQTRASEVQERTEPAVDADASNASTPSEPPAPPQPATEPEPIKALPLLFQAIKDSLIRFFRRLKGRGDRE